MKRDHSPPFRLVGWDAPYLPTCHIKMLEKYIHRLELTAIKDNWFAVKPKLNEYYVLYGNDNWVRRYRERNVEIWNKYMQEGKR